MSEFGVHASAHTGHPLVSPSLSIGVIWWEILWIATNRYEWIFVAQFICVFSSIFLNVFQVVFLLLHLIVCLSFCSIEHLSNIKRVENFGVLMKIIIIAWLNFNWIFELLNCVNWTVTSSLVDYGSSFQWTGGHLCTVILGASIDLWLVIERRFSRKWILSTC